MDRASQAERDTELSLREILGRVAGYLQFLKSKWIWPALALLLGLVAGFGYSKLGQKQEFIGRIKFLVDGAAKKSAPNPLAALGLGSAPASSGGTGSDVFEALDVTYIMTSSPILEKTLLSKITYRNQSDYVVNFFIKTKQQEKGLTGKSAFADVKLYDGVRDSLDEVQNVFIRTMIQEIGSVLKVERDPGTGLVTGTFKSTDPTFPKYFLEKLIAETSQLYTYTKTAKTLQNIRLLEHQADSVRGIMSANIASSAYSADIDPNSVRPNTVKVGFQKKAVDNAVLQSTYQTLASSLVTTRIELGKQTPFIQIYERPLFPLEKAPGSDVKLNMAKFAAGFFFLSILIISFIYFIRAFRAYVK
jgi:uncharacterized protein involved in exopolysaccharide biosynthesis